MGDSPDGTGLAPAPAPSGGDDAVGAGAKKCKACSNADLFVNVSGDPGGPLSGVTIDIAGPEPRNGTTDKKGKVKFLGVKASPPNYSVDASKTNFNNANTSKAVPPMNKATATLHLTAKTVIDVTVTDAVSGNTVKNATVRIARTGGSAEEKKTDATGHAVFVAIDNGTYDFRVTHANYKNPAEKKGIVVADNRQAETLQLDPVGDIGGIVRDKKSKDPINVANVTIKGRADIPAVSTAADGAFKFENLRTDEYEIVATANGYPDGAEKVKVRSNKREQIKIELIPPPIKIKARQKEYVVVLDTAGAAAAGYPVLEFDITDGPPNFLFDVQLGRKQKTFTGAPGLAGGWDSTKVPKDRRNDAIFSSWSNGETTLRLDAAGNATYQVPLEWWKDQARLELDSFSKLNINYRVVALSDAAGTTKFASTADGKTAPSVEIQNNLVRFRVHKLRYHKDGGTAGMWRRFARIEFKVRETNTKDMYNMVQWKNGGRTDETGANVWGVTDYGVQHESNYPTWQIDRVGTNPRYWDGAPHIEADNKTAYYEDDVSCGPPDPGHTEENTTIDFQSKMHVDADIPASVTIDAAATTTLPDGTTGVYKGVIDEDQTPVLAEKPWSARMRVTVDGAGTFKFKKL